MNHIATKEGTICEANNQKPLIDPSVWRPQIYCRPGPSSCRCTSQTFIQEQKLSARQNKLSLSKCSSSNFKIFERTIFEQLSSFLLIY
jgi:hypothetical protein